MNFPTQDSGLTTSLTPTTSGTAVQTQDTGSQVKGDFADMFAALPRTHAEEITLERVATKDTDTPLPQVDIDEAPPENDRYDAAQSSDDDESAVSRNDVPDRDTTADTDGTGEATDKGTSETSLRPPLSASERLHGLAHHQTAASATGRSDEPDLFQAIPDKDASKNGGADVNNQRHLTPASNPRHSTDDAHAVLPQGRIDESNTNTRPSAEKAVLGAALPTPSTTAAPQSASAAAPRGRDSPEVSLVREITDLPTTAAILMPRPVRQNGVAAPKSDSADRTSLPFDSDTTKVATNSDVGLKVPAQSDILIKSQTASNQPRSTQGTATINTSDRSADTQIDRAESSFTTQNLTTALPLTLTAKVEPDGRTVPVRVTTPTSTEPSAPMNSESSSQRTHSVQSAETLTTNTLAHSMQTDIRSQRSNDSVPQQSTQTRTSATTAPMQTPTRQNPSDKYNLFTTGDQAAQTVSNARTNTVTPQLKLVPEATEIKTPEGRSITKIAAPFLADIDVQSTATSTSRQAAGSSQQQPDGPHHDTPNDLTRVIQKPVEVISAAAEVPTGLSHRSGTETTNAPNSTIPGVQIGAAKPVPQAPAKPETQTASGEMHGRAGDVAPAPASQAVSVAPTLTSTQTNNWAPPALTSTQTAFSAEQRGIVEPLISLLTPSEPAELFTWDPARQLTPQTSGQQALRADMMPQITRQMAEAIPQAAQRPVEIALSPAELGRVRMSISTDDGSVVVSIIAERPETLDLMRRNIDQLGSTFRSMGYEQIAFSFGQGADTNDHAATRDEAPNSGDAASLAGSDDPTAAQTAPEHLDPLRAGTTGVDIRL